MRPLGLLLILVSCLVPLFAFGQMAAIHPNTALAAQYLGVVSLIVMAIGQMMATRFAPVEWVFGPLDKTYVLHKWLGIAAVATMYLHDTLGAEIKNLGPKGAWSDLGEELGEIGLNGILILVGLSVALFIPYKWWRLTHKLIGAFFVLSALHFLMVDKPFGLGDPVGIYVSAFCAAGALAYAVTLLPLRLRRGFAYKVSEIEQSGEATAIRLTPLAKPLPYRSGQFAFFRFDQSRLQEVHPFTLSSAPAQDGSLRISVKPLGSYTRRLGQKLEVGGKVSVQGPFGRFGTGSRKVPQIWVAGGIGVTPFLALMGDLRPDQAPVEMFYTFRGQSDAPHLQELQQAVDRQPNVTLHLIDTQIAPRLTAEHIVQKAHVALGKAKILYCGPQNLREDLARGLRDAGISRRRFHFEEFEIRSDIWPLGYINRPIREWLAKLGV